MEEEKYTKSDYVFIWGLILAGVLFLVFVFTHPQYFV